MAAANAERALSDLYTLREIGRYKTGVHRPTLSADDLVARRWLFDQLAAIGHAATIDGIANVFGRATGAGPHVLAGSHIESQNHAGWLDGALGVVYALEAARAVAEDPTLADRGAGVDVIAFADEEGHYGGFFGSRSFVGALDESAIDAVVDRTHGGRLRDALADAGLAKEPRLRLEPNRYTAFLEAHIEQGDRLETDGLSIGVVTSVVGIWQYRIVFEGDQNHAGTTRMGARRDAGVALLRLWSMIEETFPSVAGPDSVWTAGRVTLDPGGPSIIPGRAEMLFQFRDADPDRLRTMRAHLGTLVAQVADVGPCPGRLETLSEGAPAVMDPTVQAALDAAADAHAPGKHRRMPSGAGHDAQEIAPFVPSGMLFTPSIGGISHHWSEDTSDDDIKRGVVVFVDAIDRLLKAG